MNFLETNNLEISMMKNDVRYVFEILMININLLMKDSSAIRTANIDQVLVFPTNVLIGIVRLIVCTLEY